MGDDASFRGPRRVPARLTLPNPAHWALHRPLHRTLPRERAIDPDRATGRAVCPRCSDNLPREPRLSLQRGQSPTLHAGSPILPLEVTAPLPTLSQRVGSCAARHITAVLLHLHGPDMNLGNSRSACRSARLRAWARRSRTLRSIRSRVERGITPGPHRERPSRTKRPRATSHRNASEIVFDGRPDAENPSLRIASDNRAIEHGPRSKIMVVQT